MGFWDNVDRKTVEDCWEWQSRVGDRGYGRIRYDGRDRRSHRVAYEVANRGIPEGAWVLHKCDNKTCVNPAHLYAGNPKDNTQDSIEAGTHPFHTQFKQGDPSPNRRLSREDVEEIRRRYESTDATQSDIANDYDVTQATISKAVRGVYEWRE